MSKSNIRKDVGSRVRELRKAMGISQEVFADKVGYSRSYMSQIERGVANITLDAVQVLADAFRIEAKAIFDFSKTAPKKTRKILVPFAADGTSFNPSLKSLTTGKFTVGKKGSLRQFSDFDQALKHLKSMDVAYWKRPSIAGNPGTVRALKWGYIEA